MNKTILLSLVIALATSLNMKAQTDDKLFTDEDVFSSGRNYSKYAVENKTLTWWGDELIELQRRECYTINKKNGNKTLLFSLDELNSWLKPDVTFNQYSLRSVSFPYADQPLVMLRSKDGLALVDFKEHKLAWKKVYPASTAEEFSAASRNISAVKDGNLWVYDAADNGAATQVTTDGDDDNIVYGQAVHRNEWGIEGGMFWSPDGTKLAFYRMDQSMVQNYPLPSYLKGDRVEPDMTRYPMAGDVSHLVTIGVYDTATKETIYLKVGDPKDRFFTNIQWSPDNKTIYLFEVNRTQDITHLDAYCAKTGEYLKTLYTESNPKYVEPSNPIQFLPWDSNRFILQTRRDGYNHLYLINVEKGQEKQLTEGNYEVLNLLGFCKDTKSVIYVSNETHPLNHNIYSVDVRTGKRTLLDNGTGYHCGGYTKQISASGKYVYDSWSSPDVPRNIDLISTTNGKALKLLSAANPWAEMHQPIYEIGSIKAADGETDLYYRMVKPWNFDPQKKYPVVVYVYGGPHAKMVNNTWRLSSRPWETIMSQEGYIIFTLDNRGSDERGLAFEQATWHNLGVEEMKDQICGVDFLKTLPYVDADRMGVHGWSFGGFMTISLMTTYPDVFKVGVAGGPVIDWKWYEIMYGERYMGTPQNNPEGYKNTSTLPKAGRLKGRLQIITGMSDPTVVPQNCLNFLNAAESAGKIVDFYAYPDEGHNMRGHKQVTLHQRITRYFNDFLK